MTAALYEFPLTEKVRNYLRLEQLFNQVHQAKTATEPNAYLYFFKSFFELIELIDRLDLRTDFIRDMDAQQKNLQHWAQHPDIDTHALNEELNMVRDVVTDIKQNKKLGASIKEERFLNNLKQRFTIPGGATAFDLPSLFCWMRQDDSVKQQDIQRWLAHLRLVEDSITMIMRFLRERGKFEDVIGKNGFYQGNNMDKAELIRVKCDSQTANYPVLSGNTFRYGIKFMQLNPPEGTTGAVADNISFSISRC